MHAVHADLVLPGGARGRLHITEAAAAGGGRVGGASSPLGALQPGAKLEVGVLGRVATAEGRRHGVLECSSRPGVLQALKEQQQGGGVAALPAAARQLAWGALAEGQELHGWVRGRRGGGWGGVGWAREGGCWRLALPPRGALPLRAPLLPMPSPLDCRFVQEVDPAGYLWCAFTPSLRGRVFAPQAAGGTLERCRELGALFKPGQAVTVCV